MKSLLDLLPIIAIGAGYYFGDIYVATIALIASTFVALFGHWLIDRKWHKPHLIGALVSLVLGGITLFLHDPDFIKLKPSLVYGVFALALLSSHVIGDKVLVQRIPQTALVMPDAIWRRVNIAWALFFIACAGINYYVAHHFEEATWIKVKMFGFSALMLVFMLAHLPFLSRYVVQPDSEKK